MFKKIKNTLAKVISKNEPKNQVKKNTYKKKYNSNYRKKRTNYQTNRTSQKNVNINSDSERNLKVTSPQRSSPQRSSPQRSSPQRSSLNSGGEVNKTMNYRSLASYRKRRMKLDPALPEDVAFRSPEEGGDITLKIRQTHSFYSQKDKARIIFYDKSLFIDHSE
ncbi:MAG: hypothetical protein QMB22_03370 [Dehalococcoidia bacterium]|jgi:hypothetical protein